MFLKFMSDKETFTLEGVVNQNPSPGEIPSAYILILKESKDTGGLNRLFVVDKCGYFYWVKEEWQQNSILPITADALVELGKLFMVPIKPFEDFTTSSTVENLAYFLEVTEGVKENPSGGLEYLKVNAGPRIFFPSPGITTLTSIVIDLVKTMSNHGAAAEAPVDAPVSEPSYPVFTPRGTSENGVFCVFDAIFSFDRSRLSQQEIMARVAKCFLKINTDFEVRVAKWMPASTWSFYDNDRLGTKGIGVAVVHQVGNYSNDYLAGLSKYIVEEFLNVGKED